MQVRRALGTAPFEALLATANQRVSQELDELCRFKGLRVCAVDGSRLNLPSRPELEQEFGRPRSTGERRSLPQALLVTLDWLYLGWFCDWKLARYDAAELDLARDLCARLRDGDLLLADRLFFDPRWFVQLNRRGVKFLFRATANRWLSLSKSAKARVKRQRHRCACHVDLWADLHVRDPHTDKRTGTVRVRYLEIPQPGADTLRFFTNLTADVLPAQDAAKLYFQRWGVETDFRLFKGPDHLPVVLSRKPLTVRQEILLRILAHNAVRHVQALACLRQRLVQPQSTLPSQTTEQRPAGWRKRHLVEDRPILPIDLQTGQTAAIILAHIDTLAHSLCSKPPSSLDELLSEVSRHQIYAKPGRRYPRLGRKYRKGKRNKGNRRAQGERWRRRKRLAPTMQPGQT